MKPFFFSYEPLIFSTRSVRFLNSDSAAKPNTIMRRIHIFDKSVSANSFFKKKPENTRPAIFPIITAYFIPLSGSLILKRIMKPTTESTSVAIVPMLASDIQNTSPHTTSAPTAITSVSPPGSAFSMTLVIK